MKVLIHYSHREFSEVEVEVPDDTDVEELTEEDLEKILRRAGLTFTEDDELEASAEEVEP